MIKEVVKQLSGRASLLHINLKGEFTWKGIYCLYTTQGYVEKRVRERDISIYEWGSERAALHSNKETLRTLIVIVFFSLEILMEKRFLLACFKQQ